MGPGRKRDGTYFSPPQRLSRPPQRSRPHCCCCSGGYASCPSLLYVSTSLRDSSSSSSTYSTSSKLCPFSGSWKFATKRQASERAVIEKATSNRKLVLVLEADKFESSPFYPRRTWLSDATVNLLHTHLPHLNHEIAKERGGKPNKQPRLATRSEHSPGVFIKTFTESLHVRTTDIR